MNEGGALSAEQKRKGVRNRRVHMANERTFLAWVRTSIAIMAFGFVVEKFALFVRQIASLLGAQTSMPPRGYSSIIGVVLVVLGALMGVLSFIRFKKTERQIDEDTYQPSPLLALLLTLALLGIGAFLALYLLHSL